MASHVQTLGILNTVADILSEKLPRLRRIGPDETRHPGKGYGLVNRQEWQDVRTVFELTNPNQAD